MTLLNKKLKLAVTEEQYAEAARLRDSINSVMAADPGRQLEAALSSAVTEEHFEVGCSTGGTPCVCWLQVTLHS